MFMRCNYHEILDTTTFRWRFFFLYHQNKQYDNVHRLGKKFPFALLPYLFTTNEKSLWLLIVKNKNEWCSVHKKTLNIWKTQYLLNDKFQIWTKKININLRRHFCLPNVWLTITVKQKLCPYKRSDLQPCHFQNH